LSERQWGTVREDYSAHGTAWDYFPHDHARSRAYRWGEDGLLGISDNHQRLCFALALWNEKDPILKERVFGLTGPQGNHGEDVKDYYFYLDSTPTHSYMKGLYKYPQGEFPYRWLVEENRRRGRRDAEFELVDTGIFEGDRNFDVVIEYAKAAPDDLLIRITATNRGPDPAPLHLLPTLWCRNTWAWEPEAVRPRLRLTAAGGKACILVEHPELGQPYRLYCDGDPAICPRSGAETRGRGNPRRSDRGCVLLKRAGKRASLSSTQNLGSPTDCTATAIPRSSSPRTTPISDAFTGSRIRAALSRTPFTSTSSTGKLEP